MEWVLRDQDPRPCRSQRSFAFSWSEFGIYVQVLNREQHKRDKG
jgi:hypothetical protein